MTKTRWLRDETSGKGGRRVVAPVVEEFLEELHKLYKKYNISISHEDGHGAFIIETYNLGNFEWLDEASIENSIHYKEISKDGI